MTEPLDPELLAAFLPEWEAAAAALAGAGATAAPRLLDQLRGMAGAFGLRSLSEILATAEPLPEPFAPGALAGLAARLRAQAARIAEAGADLPPPEEAPPRDASPPEGCRVLLVDDSAMMRRLLRESRPPTPPSSWWARPPTAMPRWSAWRRCARTSPCWISRCRSWTESAPCAPGA
ncbi:hypothetical protein [Teichococcus aestuarii]|uniref:hypothetical protein n=1 Tax=Teichococcus aestuarii TaxID=568898 RepID=UPI0036238037